MADYSMPVAPAKFGPPILLRGQAKECCTNRLNFEVWSKQGTMEVFRCRRCGCKHYEMAVAPGRLGVTLT